VGAPNVGKSSLLNRLLGTERSIVTAEAGTTRDTVEESFSYKGARFVLTDTAGIRAAASEAERLGVERSLQAAREADIHIAVPDAEETAVIQEEAERNNEIKASMLQQTFPYELPREKPIIFVKNKIDLYPHESRTTNHEPRTQICVSALTGENIDALKEAIYDTTVGKISAHGATLNNLRQFTAVVRASEALERLEVSKELSLDCMLSDLSEAYRELGTVTGVTATDAIVDEIFSKFCVGK